MGTIDFADERRFVVREVPDVEPAEGQALVRTLLVGRSASDVAIEKGRFGTPPAGAHHIIPGHEVLGIVERLGEQCPPWLRRGDLVVSTVRRPCQPACAACLREAVDFCISGREQERGLRGAHGFLAQYFVEDPQYLVRVPGELDEQGVLVEPMSLVQKALDEVYAVQQRSPWQPRRALIAGGGAQALLAAAACCLRGFKVVVVGAAAPDSPAAAAADEIGARYVTSESSAAVVASGETPADLILSMAGAQVRLQQLAPALAPDGIAVQFAPYGGGEHSGPLAALRDNQVVMSCRGARVRHYRDAVRDMLELSHRHPSFLPRLCAERVGLEDWSAVDRVGAEALKTMVAFG